MNIDFKKLIFLQRFIVKIKLTIYRKVFGMTIGKGTIISLKANLDKTNPKGVVIGNDTYIAFGATILTHDMVRQIRTKTKIGDNCFIGGESIILPGLTIGNSCIVAAGSVVTNDVPSNSIVAGNPAKVIRSEIKTKRFGILIRDV